MNNIIIEKINIILKDFNIKDVDFNKNIADLGINSLVFLRIISTFESDYNIKFEDEEIINLNYSLQDLVELISKKINIAL